MFTRNALIGLFNHTTRTVLPSSLNCLTMGGSQNATALFIAVEGADRTGKSTQVSLLGAALEKLTHRKPLILKFPDRETALGQCLNDYLTGRHDIDPHALHLLFTANRWEKQDELRKALSSGRCVVADRYSFSGIAYTAAKPPPTPSWQWCCDMEKGLAEPDIVICLTPERLDHLKNRSGFGDERYETDDFQQRVLENYVRLSKDIQYANYCELGPDGQERMPPESWFFVQATNKTVEQVHDCIMSIVKNKLESMQSPEIAATN